MANSENTRQKPQPKDDEIDLRQIWDVLSFNKYKIIASGGVGLLLALVYVLVASPVYEANDLVQIETNKQNNILGDAQALLGGGGGSKSDAEINLARSRMVLGRTVDEVKSDVVIAYKQMPIIGPVFSSKEVKAEEALKINVFSVPDDLYNKNLELVYQGNKKFTLIIPEIKKLPEVRVDGEVGKLLSYNGLLFNLQSITAESGDGFTITKLSKLKAIDTIKDGLSIGDVGKDTGILTFNFVGTDKEKIQLLLNSVIKNYEHQNKEFEVLSAGRSLEFIDKQLPVNLYYNRFLHHPMMNLYHLPH